MDLAWRLWYGLVDFTGYYGAIALVAVAIVAAVYWVLGRSS
jgi:hypothetical protein